MHAGSILPFNEAIGDMLSPSVNKNQGGLCESSARGSVEKADGFVLRVYMFAFLLFYFSLVVSVAFFWC